MWVLDGECLKKTNLIIMHESLSSKNKIKNKISLLLKLSCLLCAFWLLMELAQERLLAYPGVCTTQYNSR